MWVVRLAFVILTIISKNLTVCNAEAHPCANVFCYYNAMCVVDPDTNEGFCDCPASECDSYPYSPICAEGITFSSPCHAHMHMCNLQRNIKVQHNGVCDDTDCGPTNPCPFNGVCVDGSCTCYACNNTVYDIDGRSGPSQPVCGSNGIRYNSECLMRYDSCSSKTVIKIAEETECASEIGSLKAKPKEEHLRHWISEIESEDSKIDSEITSRRIRGTVFQAGGCRKVELRGCLPLSHPRKQHLGTYIRDPAMQQSGSPVYTRAKDLRYGGKSAYLSRFTSVKVLNGSWIIGSQVGNGRGWFGVSDPSSDPRNISSMWYSTSGTRDSPWRKEPTIRLHCLGETLKRKYPLSDCIYDEVMGTYETNENSNIELPLYQMTLTNMSGGSPSNYRPGERIKVTVAHNDHKNRFDTVYIVMRNDIDECGVPYLKKSRKRFQSRCYGQMISRKAGRMGRIKMYFNMPLRGCVTFYVLLKSIRDEVYYDSSTLGISKHLSKTLCAEAERLD